VDDSIASWPVGRLGPVVVSGSSCWGRTPYAGGRVQPLRRLQFADSRLVVTQLGVRADLVEARVFEGSL